MLIDGIPNWVLWLGAGIGVAISTAVGGIGRAWGARIKEAAATRNPVEFAGAIDSRAVDRLAAAVEAQTTEMIVTRKKAEDFAHMTGRQVEMVVERMKRHEQAIEDMTEAIRRK